jgi:hypothetical protein
MKQPNYRQSHLSGETSPKNALRDAEVLALFGEVFRARGNEIELLLDLASCVIESAAPFPEKTPLESTLKLIRTSLRNLMGSPLETTVPFRAATDEWVALVELR